MFIECLGAFRVLRHGSPVPASGWQSRKSRDLLKLLVCRRGLPTPREALTERLWPDEDAGVTSHRLSVALAVLRSVLDPHRRLGRDHFVGSDGCSVRLRPDRARVEVEDFLARAASGRRLLAQGQAAEGRREISAAVEAYRGDFLEEDVYEDWAGPLREQARSAYLCAVRALAEGAARQGDHPTAVSHFLRALEHDPYDEGAHLGLVGVLAAWGSHGEARRRYGFYRDRMGEIDVGPAPFPGRGSVNPAWVLSTVTGRPGSPAPARLARLTG